MSYYGFKPYVPVAARRAQAAREASKLAKGGRVLAPVQIAGRLIAASFWGKSWCDNLERYSDFANRLPRGRTYVRNGSVIDLQISRGRVEALVSGSEMYRIKIDIAVAAPERWKAISGDCAGSVGTIVELLQGKLAKHVMERVCRDGDGLFPTPKEIALSCSCPDWADMCKHVAAALYGVGARLDRDPDLLFKLRGVERGDLVTNVGADLPLTRGRPSDRALADDDVAALFGLDMEGPAAAPPIKPRLEARELAKLSAKIKALPPRTGSGRAAPPPVPKVVVFPVKAVDAPARKPSVGKVIASPRPVAFVSPKSTAALVGAPAKVASKALSAKPAPAKRGRPRKTPATSR